MLGSFLVCCRGNGCPCLLQRKHFCFAHLFFMVVVVAAAVVVVLQLVLVLAVGIVAVQFRLLAWQWRRQHGKYLRG